MSRHWLKENIAKRTSGNILHPEYIKKCYNSIEKRKISEKKSLGQKFADISWSINIWKGCSASWMIKKMQVKNAMRYLCTPTRLAFIYKTERAKCWFSSVQSLSRVQLFATPWIVTAHNCPSSTPGVHSNSCPSSWWCHPAISSSVVPFSSCPQSLPASGSFPMSQLLAWDGQSIRVSASASILPMNTQDWSPLGWTGWISLQSKGLSEVFSNTTVQKHQSSFLSFLHSVGRKV